MHTILTTNDDKADEAARQQVREIFVQKGLLTISDVGDSASYDFVFLGTVTQSPEFQAQLLAKVKEAAARHAIAADAAIFCETYIRLDGIKKAARARPPANPGLRDEIEQMVAADQAVRQKQAFDPKKMMETDRQLAQHVQQIVDKYGVPTYDMVGPKAADQFVLLVQHQSPQLRQAVLPKLKANVDAGQADPGSYALVYDRSQSDMGQKQRYGDNLVCGPDGKLHKGAIEDEAHVNQRRAELGLMRLELYLWLVKEVSPPSCQPAAAPK